MSRKLEDVAYIHYGKSPQAVIDVDGTVPVVGTGGPFGLASKALFKGPAVVVPRKGSLGNPQYVEGPFWPVDTTFAVLPRQGINARWLFYNLDQYDLTRLNEATGVPSINRNWLCRVPISAAEPPMQNGIAKVLGTIDRVVEQTEALVSKLRYVRAGLMHDLFTRGIMPNGELRRPREEAPHLYRKSPLGWIPKEWTIATVSEMCSIVVDCPHSTPEYVESGVPCIRTADLLPGELLVGEARRVSEKTYAQRVVRLVPKTGDIVYSREGERLGIASPIGDERVCLGQRVMLLRPNEKADTNFLLWAMNSSEVYRGVFAGLGATTSPHVNMGDVCKQPICRPKREEQARIGVALRSYQERLRTESALLRSYLALKSGLMSDLLSGRVRVSESMLREVASR
jgi:type I restriction enzyme S subunit